MWNLEVRYGDTVILEGFAMTEAKANEIADRYVLDVVLKNWPPEAPTKRVWCGDSSRSNQGQKP